MYDSKKLFNAIISTDPKADSVYAACNNLGTFASSTDKETAKELKNLIDDNRNKNELEALIILLPKLQERISNYTKSKSKFLKKIIKILFAQIFPDVSKDVKTKTKFELEALNRELPKATKTTKTTKTTIYANLNKLLKENNLYDRDYSELNRLVYLFTKKVNPNKNPNDPLSLNYHQLVDLPIFKTAYTFIRQSPRFNPLIKKIQELGFKIDGLPEQKVGACLALFKLILPKEHPINTNKEFALALNSSSGNVSKLSTINATTFNCFPYSYQDCGIDGQYLAKFPSSDRNKVNPANSQDDWNNAHFQTPCRIASAGPQFPADVPLFLMGVINRKPAVVISLGNPFSNGGFLNITNPIEQNGEFLVTDQNAPYKVTTSFLESQGLDLKIERKGVSHTCAYFILNLPDNQPIIFDKNLVDFILNIHERSKRETIIIHCASGVGRTGFVLYLLALLDKLEIDKKFNTCISKLIDLAVPAGTEKNPEQARLLIEDINYVEQVFTNTLDKLRQKRYSVQSEVQIGNVLSQFANLAAAKLNYAPELVAMLCEEAKGGFTPYTTMYTDKKNVSNTATQQTTTTTTSISTITPAVAATENPYNTFIPTQSPTEPVIMPTKARKAILNILPSEIPKPTSPALQTETTNPYNSFTQVLEITGKKIDQLPTPNKTVTEDSRYSGIPPTLLKKNNQQPGVQNQTSHAQLIQQFNKLEIPKTPETRPRSTVRILKPVATTVSAPPQNKPEPPKQEQKQTANINTEPTKSNNSNSYNNSSNDDQSTSNFTKK